MQKIHTFTAIAALALAGTAYADDRGVPGVDVDTNAGITMPSVDKNSDGKVTRSEAASNQRLSQGFDKFDANKDGSLDKGEFAKFQSKASMKGTGNKDGAPGNDEGEPAQTIDRPGTTDDSTEGNPDKLGPGR